MFLLSIVRDVIVTACTQAWATGDNREGQLGLGDTSDRLYSPEMLPSPTRIVRIAAGTYRSMLIAKV